MPKENKKCYSKKAVKTAPATSNAVISLDFLMFMVKSTAFTEKAETTVLTNAEKKKTK